MNKIAVAFEEAKKEHAELLEQLDYLERQERGGLRTECRNLESELVYYASGQGINQLYSSEG